MVTNKRLQKMIGLIAVILLLTGCGGAPTEPAIEATPIPAAATPVPPTATPIPPTATAVPAATTALPIVELQGDLQPLSETDCIDLADAMSQALGIPGDTAVAPFDDYVSGKNGAGCQTTVTGTGNDFQHVGAIADTLTEMLRSREWQEDINYAGGGAGGLIAGFRKADGLCLLVVNSGPSDEGLCSNDEPFAACWERLTPEQRIFTITLNCTQDTAVPPEPKRIQPSFQPVVAQLESTGVPLMLPSDLPVGEDLPPLHPYIFTIRPGEYEMSLDFGADCRGAGACHYGSLTGKKVDSSAPVGTRNFVFEAERAQKVTLVNDIEAYFIESRCGANCDDAKVFWIYNGFQYMVGLKGGRQSDVLNLANATIENSIP